MRENRAMGIVLPGHENRMMGALIDGRTIGSIPFGGRYRLIDFALSNMVHAGIWDVGVLTRDRYQSLMDHLGSGRDWDLARKGGGLSLLPPMVASSGSEAYRGEIESLVAYRRYIADTPARYVIMGGADLVCNIDVNQVIEAHVQSDADITVVYDVISDERDLGETSVVFSFDSGQRVVDVTVGAPWSGPCNRSLDLMVMEKERLLSLITELSSHNCYRISRDLLQARHKTLDIRGHLLEGYCVKIQNLESYYRANMQLLDPAIRASLFGGDHPILTRVHDEPPAKYGLSAKVRNSLLADGCIVEGEVENCVLFRGVKIGKGAVVRDSIIMQNTEIGARAQLSYVIADRRCFIKEERVLSGFSSYPVVIGRGSVV